jgi:glycosyltransferase 2 family protein
MIGAGAVLYSRMRPRERKERGRLRRLVRDTIDEVASPIGRRRVAIALALSFLAWGIWAVTAGLVARSLGITLSPIELVFVTAVINLGVVIPSSPGFIGTYQWLGVSALAAVGVGHEVAIAFSVLMQAVWYVPTTIVGGVIAVREVHREATRDRRATGPSVPSPP